jgi:hypothetical protein
MSAWSGREPQPQGNPFMVIFGAVILAAVALYFGFMAADGMGLASRQATARVTGKEYRDPGTTYTTQVIGGKTHSIPRATSEMYLLGLDIDGRETQAPVTKELYSAVRTGDRLAVRYQQRRLTGGLQVLDVTDPRDSR